MLFLSSAILSLMRMGAIHLAPTLVLLLQKYHDHLE